MYTCALDKILFFFFFFFFFFFCFPVQTVLTEEEKAQFKPVCGNLKKGEASFHHALSVHGSYGNRYQ